MRKLIVATDSNLKVYVAYVDSQKAEKALLEKLQSQGKSPLVWNERDIQVLTLDNIMYGTR